MDLSILLLAAWLPIAGIVLALCLYESEEQSERARLRPAVKPNPADES